MNVITILNEKGGVGKTTIAVTVAAGLAARGHRVLVIDADAQGHATRALGLRKYPGLCDLLVRSEQRSAEDEPPMDNIYEYVLRAIPAERYGGAGASRLYVIGSNVETRNIATSISDAYALVRKLTPIMDLFDYCLIDTAPTPSLLHGAIYLATDWILYPTLCEFWSFDGLAESMAHQQAVQRSVRPVEVAGIVPMRVRANTLEHSENLRKLQERFGALVWQPVPERIVWAEASTYQKPVFVHDPGSEAAGHAWALVDRVEALYG